MAELTFKRLILGKNIDIDDVRISEYVYIFKFMDEDRLFVGHFLADKESVYIPINVQYEEPVSNIEYFFDPGVGRQQL